MNPTSTAPRVRIASRDGGVCPGCEKIIRTGDTLLYEHRSWPWVHDPRNTGYWSRPGEVLWHTACITAALTAALCGNCGQLHPQDGRCLL